VCVSVDISVTLKMVVSPAKEGRDAVRLNKKTRNFIRFLVITLSANEIFTTCAYKESCEFRHSHISFPSLLTD
jgi:hypothetical protein